tara:strand:- start:2810 stop:3229 length:420 start_codon:yes stop_codon:yes gene_type:complete
MKTQLMIIRYAGIYNHQTKQFDRSDTIARPVSTETIELLARDFSRIEDIELVELQGAEIELDDEADEAVRTWNAVQTYLTKTEAIETLGVSDRTLQRMVNRGKVERKMKGREARYRLFDKETDRSVKTLNAIRSYMENP